MSGVNGSGNSVVSTAPTLEDIERSSKETLAFQFKMQQVNQAHQLQASAIDVGTSMVSGTARSVKDGANH